MDEQTATRASRSPTRVQPRTAKYAGVLACAVGLVLVALYPLHSSGELTMSFVWPADGTTVPAPRRWEYLPPSVVVGPLLVAWGAFAARDESFTPLTARRALLAPALGVLSLGAGVARFVYQMDRVTPVLLNTDTGGEQTFDPSLADVVQMELWGFEFLLLGGLSGVVVGVVAARASRRRTLASAALPAGFVGVAVLWEFWQGVAFDLLAVAVGGGATVVLGSIPFAVGYLAASES